MFLNAVRGIHSFKFLCLHCMSSIVAHSERDACYRLWRNQSVKWFVKYTALDILVVSFIYLSIFHLFWSFDSCFVLSIIIILWYIIMANFASRTKLKQRPWLILKLRVSERQNHWLCHKGCKMEGKSQKYENMEKQRQGKALMLRFLIGDMHPAATWY